MPEPSSVLKELKIIKAEIRRLKDENKLTNSRIRSLENKLEDEAALIREQNLEFKDEILGEIKAIKLRVNFKRGLAKGYSPQSVAGFGVWGLPCLSHSPPTQTQVFF